MTILELMKRIPNLPKLAAALQKGQAAFRQLENDRAAAAADIQNLLKQGEARLKQLGEDSKIQLGIMEEQAVVIADFFGEELTGDPKTIDKELVIPEVLEKTLLPAETPRKKYEKIIALLRAAPSGLTFREIVACWKALEWDGWHLPPEKLDQQLRDAIKTARGAENSTIKHTGGHSGKFQIS